MILVAEEGGDRSLNAKEGRLISSLLLNAVTPIWMELCVCHCSGEKGQEGMDGASLLSSL